MNAQLTGCVNRGGLRLTPVLPVLVFALASYKVSWVRLELLADSRMLGEVFVKVMMIRSPSRISSEEWVMIKIDADSGMVIEKVIEIFKLPLLKRLSGSSLRNSHC